MHLSFCSHTNMTCIFTLDLRVRKESLEYRLESHAGRVASPSEQCSLILSAMIASPFIADSTEGHSYSTLTQAEVPAFQCLWMVGGELGVDGADSDASLVQ